MATVPSVSYTSGGSLDPAILAYYQNNPAFSAMYQVGTPIVAGVYQIRPEYAAYDGQGDSGAMPSNTVTGYSAWNGTSDKYDQYDVNGKYLGAMALDSSSPMAKYGWIIPAIFSGGALAGVGGLGAGAAAEGGFGAAAGGAGVTGLGDAGAMYAGLDAGAAGSLGGGASILGGSSIGSGLAAGTGAIAAGSSGASQAAIDAAAQSAAQGGTDALGKAALDGTNIFGANSVNGALDISALSGAPAGSAAAQALGQIANNAGYSSLQAMVNQLGSSGAASLLKSAIGSNTSLGSLIGPAVNALGSFASAGAAKSAANAAGNAQLQASQAGIAEWARQFDTVRQLLGPYAQTGTQAMGAQADLAGLNGADKQQAAVTAIQNMPAFQSQLKLGENRILQNASATGGLRGGNTQGALAWYAPSLLAQQITNQYSQLGGLSGLGENAAAGVGNAAMTTAGGTSSLLQQGGAAQAGSDLASGVADQKLYGNLASAIGQLFGYGGNALTNGVPTPV